MLRLLLRDSALGKAKNAVEPTNGFELWRQLHREHEAQVKSRYGGMLSRIIGAKFPGEKEAELEAWERLTPVRHYTPLPFVVFCLLVERFFARGDVGLALITWLTYHGVLRPGDPLLARVSDLSLPRTVDDIVHQRMNVEGSHVL